MIAYPIEKKKMFKREKLKLVIIPPKTNQTMSHTLIPTNNTHFPLFAIDIATSHKVNSDSAVHCTVYIMQCNPLLNNDIPSFIIPLL